MIKNKITMTSDLFPYPCPTVLVTSSNFESVENIITISWTGIISSNPEYISISIRPSRFSHSIISSSSVFGVNIPTTNMLYAVDFCGNKSGKEIDKFSECKFHKFKGDLTGIPLIHECPINMECSVENIIPLGSHDLFISKVLRKYVDENFIIDDNSPITLDVITYVKPNYYQINNEVLGKYGYTNKK